MSSDAILANLNEAQKAAVSSPAQQVAILAGPGSGKTHTLTSRVAWLLKHERLQPWNIIVATFTVKAAREMKERIGRLIGDGLESQLILGTFHSIARRYLSRYGHLIGIRKDFGIADSADSIAIIKRIVKRHSLQIEPKLARSRISSRKAKGGDTSTLVVGKQSDEKAQETQEIDVCYNEYEDSLKRSNLLDYDDLLLRCVDLLRAHPSCVSNVEAVLIDEFQDTNLVQFDLMRLFAAQRKRVTIVGDPDQSIYGFRSAETKNFKRMLRQYPNTVTIPLEENYRSSGAILLTALEVIQQDDSRIAKSLLATHSVGTRPVLRKLSSAHNEGAWIVTEIKRAMALTGGLLNFDDIAILLRSASLSRHVEYALGKGGISYRMVGGHRFYDRVEVKILLDYLRVIDQPDNNDAMVRIMNVPSRRIGDTTMKALIEEADQSHQTLWALVLDCVQGRKTIKTKLAKQTEQGVALFVNIVLGARKKMFDDAVTSLSIVELLEHIMKKISYEDFLEKSNPKEEEHEAKWANVQELISLAADFSDVVSTGYDDELLPIVDGLTQEDTSRPLSKFLANIALASDAKAIGADGPPQAQVTVSTIHAAKGLEWPVVFILGAYQGSIPHSRADDTEEERRLLYVAMTRAKALLYMSCPMKNSQREEATLSPFLTPSSLKPYLDDKGPAFKSSVVQSIAHILQRQCPQPINQERALLDIRSLHDDLFPRDGEEAEKNSEDFYVFDGTHHYTQGQQRPKRRRLEGFGSKEELNNDGHNWQPGYTTTMDRMAASGGFVTAGAHMQVLQDQSTNSILEKPEVIDVESTHKKAAKVSARTTKRAAGQASISSFFGRSTSDLTEKTPRVEPKAPIPAIRRSVSTSYRTPQVQQYTQAPSISAAPSISPLLGGHRIGSRVLPGLPRQHKDVESAPKRAYVFLSSPPQEYASVEKNLEEVPEMTLEELSQSPPRAALNTMPRPAKTLHTTTMQRMNTLNGPPPKKVLGMRRETKPWVNSQSKGFTPPTITRPLRNG